MNKSDTHRDELSHSFEYRYFSVDPAADGETDFHGEEAFLDLDDRMRFLNGYADYATRFFDDTELDTEVISDEEVAELTQRIKPQPLPEVRTRIPLTEWRKMGHREGLRTAQQAQLEAWNARPGLAAGNGRLLFEEDAEITLDFAAAAWRFKIVIRLDTTESSKPLELVLAGDEGTALRTEIPGDEADVTATVEVDLEDGGYNVYLDRRKVVDFAPLETEGIAAVDRIVISGGAGTRIEELVGTAYDRNDDVQAPFFLRTFLDETFSVVPEMTGWECEEYDDSEWATDTAPVVHGGERHAAEDLYLRTGVDVGGFERATLHVETLDPGGDVWVNGSVVAHTDNRRPLEIDVTDRLRADGRNTIAVHVPHFHSTRAKAGFAPTDLHIGWFAGRIHLDLTGTDYIREAFAWTSELTGVRTDATPAVRAEAFEADERESGGRALSGLEAKLGVRASIRNCWKEIYFEGTLRIRVYPWYPSEGDRPVAEAELPIRAPEWQDLAVEHEVTIPDAEPWTPEHPVLYRVHMLLVDSDGNEVDDEVLTTGIRTISQEGGTFRLNGEPTLLAGAQIFGYRSPVEHLATWHRCPPAEWLVREIAQIKRMNGNLMRIHVHAWAHIPPARNVNDPRLAEIGDQLGIMFMWATTSWVRSGTPWGVDLEGLPAYVRQVRNRPSIVLWEISNHPTCNQLYDRGSADWDRYYRAVHEAIYPNDPSRLILPSAIVGTGGGTPAMDLPMMARGTMLSPLGMGRTWDILRRFPADHPDLAEYLCRKYRAYINTETHASIGQPNWSLVRGKPWHHLQSYEWHTDEKCLGRKLEADEWRESQALQAFSGYEQLKKMRLLDIDGYSWCSLHDGPNTCTYKKPLIDFEGRAKLAWHTFRMVSSPVLASADDVDVVIGPNDTIRPVVMNLGRQRDVDVCIEVKDASGNTVDGREYRQVRLEAGRTVTRLPAYRPEVNKPGCYAVEYRVTDADGPVR